MAKEKSLITRSTAVDVNQAYKGVVEAFRRARECRISFKENFAPLAKVCLFLLTSTQTIDSNQACAARKRRCGGNSNDISTYACFHLPGM